ncbi:MAG: hypothetical protein AAF518_17865 [Spirochaetota bacterium]
MWQRIVTIERYQKIRQEAWKGEERGSRVRILQKKRKIRRYESRKVGKKKEVYWEIVRYRKGSRKECSERDGKTICQSVPRYAEKRVKKKRRIDTFKEFPVYDTWVIYESYQYYKWKKIQTRGRKQKLHSPEVSLEIGAKGKPDRIGGIHSEYLVILHKKHRQSSQLIKFAILTNAKNYQSKYQLGQEIQFLSDKNGRPILDYGETFLDSKQASQKEKEFTESAPNSL